MENTTKRQTARFAIGLCVLCAIALLGAVAVLAPGVSDAAPDSAAPKASGTAAQSAVVSPIPKNPGAYEPGELIVTFNDRGAGETSVSAARKAVEAAGAQVSAVLTYACDYVGTTLLVTTDSTHRVGDDLAAAAGTIADQRGVARVQPNYRYTAAASASDVAQDIDAGKQYYLNDWDTSHGANATAAWGKVGSSARVDVAVLDTGIYHMQEYSGPNELVTSSDNFHQEFSEANLNISAGLDFVHKDENGAPRPLVNEENPFGDDNGHGTHVSAIIAAHAKTAASPDVLPVGMAGVSQNARIIPLKVLDSAAKGDTADFIAALDYLIQKKASGELENLHVVNMSLSYLYLDDEDVEDEDEDDPLIDDSLRAVIQEAQANDIVTVCAVGNTSMGKTYKNKISAYEECVSVTATDEEGRDADYANNNGDEDIAAPGSAIYSAWASQGDAYTQLDGTSQATAIVSGVFSMLWAKNPNLTAQQARNAVLGTATQETLPGETPELSGASLASQGDNSDEHPDMNLGVPTAQAVGSRELSPGSLYVGGLKAASTKQHYMIDAAAALDAVESGALKTVLTDDMVTLSQAKCDYTGVAQEPAVTVKAYGVTLRADVDYEVSYSNNVQPGTATVKVAGKGDYTGTVEKTFQIVKAGGSSDSPTPTDDPKATLDLSKATITPAKKSYAYTGRPLKPAVTVKLDGKVVAAKNYKLTYANNTNASTAKKKATVKVTGTGSYSGSKTVSFTITPKALTKKMVTLSKAKRVYTGKAIKPAVTVRQGKVKLAKSNYTATYKNNKNVGTAKMQVKGKGNYTGTVNVAFKIVPKGTSIGTLKAGKKQFRVTWKKQAKQTTGYQVRYSLKKNMAKAKTKTIAKPKTTKLKVAKLKSGKTYYVQVRTYKKVGKAKYYSAWSTKKRVRVR